MCKKLKFSSGVIKSRAKEVRECDQNADKSHTNATSTSEDEKAGNKTGKSGERNDNDGSSLKIHSLAVMLLVEFVESLEKAMFNASDGCAVAVPPPNKVCQSPCYILF